MLLCWVCCHVLCVHLFFSGSVCIADTVLCLNDCYVPLLTSCLFSVMLSSWLLSVLTSWLFLWCWLVSLMASLLFSVMVIIWHVDYLVEWFLCWIVYYFLWCWLVEAVDVIRRAGEQHLPSQAAQVRRVDQSSPDVSRTTGTLISTHFYTRISTLHKLGFLQHFIVEGTTATGGDRIIKISVDCLTEFHLFSIAWVWESISESLCELRNHKWTAERPRKILWTAKSTKFAWQKNEENVCHVFGIVIMASPVFIARE